MVGITKVRTHLRMARSVSERVRFHVAGCSPRAFDHTALACRTKSLLNISIRNAITFYAHHIPEQKRTGDILGLARIASYSYHRVKVAERGAVTALLV